MDASRLRALLTEANLSQRLLADLAGWPDREVRRWAAGARPIPDDAAAWIDELMALLARAPRI